MFSAGPPDPAGTAPGTGGPLRVARATRRVFGGSSEAALDPMLRRYLSDMVAPYGLAMREELLARGAGHSYGEMAGELLALTVPPGEPVDLLVLAFAMHDVVPGRSTAAHLSHLCPGSPMAFAVCDQGAAAPFTGLRLIREYARSDGCRSALLMVVEQAALHYELAAPAPVPACHTAVALACGAAGPGHLGPVRQHAGVPPAEAAGLLAAELDRLSAGRDDMTLIAGRELASPAGAAVLGAVTPAVTQVLRAPDGQPCTGLWWQLAGHLAGWAQAGRHVLLADYDPVLEYLCLAVVDVEASPAAASPLAAQQAP